MDAGVTGMHFALDYLFQLRDLALECERFLSEQFRAVNVLTY